MYANLPSIFLQITQFQIQSWIDIILKGSDEAKKDLSQENGKYYLILNPANAFIRRLLYQEIEAKYKSIVSVLKLDEDNKVGWMEMKNTV